MLGRARSRERDDKPIIREMTRCVRTAWWPALMLAVAGCGGDSGGGPTLSFSLPTDPAAPLAVVDLPFPSDVFRDANRQLIMPPESLPFGPNADPSAVAAMAHAFEARDCFGP